MHADVIVLGTGGVGSAALYQLARRGVKGIGLDRFPPGHDRGSSHGESRIIRMSYHEHPNYVPLLRSAYALWDELCEARGENLFHRTGQVYYGTPDGPVLDGVLSSARLHDLDVEELSADEARARFPAHAPPEGHAAVYEPNAGYLLVEDCVRAHLEEAVKLGARHAHGEAVTGWTASDNGVTVQTERETYTADRLIVTAGCWSTVLLQELGIPLRIVRKHLHWHATDDPVYLESNGCPCFFFATLGGFFYGFPQRDAAGVKVAEHSGGETISDPLADPRESDPRDVERIEMFLTRCMPGVSLERTRHEVCFYTMTPDENFVIDRHPEYESVVFTAGLSGHGFKFTSALGAILADLALEGESNFDLDFLSLRRPGLRG